MKIRLSGVDTLFGLRNCPNGYLFRSFCVLFEYMFDAVFYVFFSVGACSIWVSFWALFGSLSGPKGIPKRRTKGAQRMFYVEPSFGDHFV